MWVVFFFFLECNILILKFYMKSKELCIVKTILKKNKVGEFTLLHFKYYKARVIKTVWYQEKDRQMRQWSRTSLEIDISRNRLKRAIDFQQRH